MHFTPPALRRSAPLVLTSLLLGTPALLAGDRQGSLALVQALRMGGHVLVMRHASSPQNPPEPGSANPDNRRQERQLDEVGRRTARDMGDAIRKLRIPIGSVFSSPTYRALETLRLAGIEAVTPIEQLGEVARGMQGTADTERSGWLRAKVAEAPQGGGNTLLITHTPNMVGAFGDQASNVQAGEALIFRPDGRGGAQLLTRIKIEDWPRLAGP